MNDIDPFELEPAVAPTVVPVVEPVAVEVPVAAAVVPAERDAAIFCTNVVPDVVSVPTLTRTRKVLAYATLAKAVDLFSRFMFEDGAENSAQYKHDVKLFALCSKALHCLGDDAEFTELAWSAVEYVHGNPSEVREPILIALWPLLEFAFKARD